MLSCTRHTRPMFNIHVLKSHSRQVMRSDKIASTTPNRAYFISNRQMVVDVQIGQQDIKEKLRLIRLA